jgi:hypothetical protein
MATHDDAEEPTLDVAHGDPALARHLRGCLEMLRDRTDNDEYRRLADEVLAGRASLRDVYFTPAFSAGIDHGVEQFARRYDELSPEERAEMAEQGRQAFQAERDRLANEN